MEVSLYTHYLSEIFSFGDIFLSMFHTQFTPPPGSAPEVAVVLSCSPALSNSTNKLSNSQHSNRVHVVDMWNSRPRLERKAYLWQDTLHELQWMQAQV